MSRSKLLLRKMFQRSHSEEASDRDDLTSDDGNNVPSSNSKSPMGMKKKRDLRRVKSFDYGSQRPNVSALDLLPKKKRHSAFENTRMSQDSLSVLGLMFYAVQYNNMEMLDQLVNDNRDIDVNQLNEDGIAVVHFAAMVGSLETFHVLAKYGVDFNVEDIRGNSPLDYAALMKTYEIGRYLLENGCRSDKQSTMTTLSLETDVHPLFRNLHIHERTMGSTSGSSS